MKIWRYFEHKLNFFWFVTFTVIVKIFKWLTKCWCSARTCKEYKGCIFKNLNIYCFRREDYDYWKSLSVDISIWHTADPQKTSTLQTMGLKVVIDHGWEKSSEHLFPWLIINKNEEISYGVAFWVINWFF